MMKMKSIDTYITEKFKISKGIKVLDNFYILVPREDICGYCIKNYKKNLYDGNLTYSSMFDWKSVFVLYWKDIIDIFRYYKHNTPSNDFSLDNFLIYDIKNVDSYSSIEDFLDKVKKRQVKAKDFVYNKKYTEELDETIK